MLDQCKLKCVQQHVTKTAIVTLMECMASVDGSDKLENFRADDVYLMSESLAITEKSKCHLIFQLENGTLAYVIPDLWRDGC